MKKFLSLVLALVMAMSLVTISAGAADFKDEASIDPIYAEAVDVISALGIVSGNNGSYLPQDNLTRGAAAKILAGVKLGADLAAKLPKTSAFSDVAAGSTFAGYISYLKDEGIVGGYGDGTFGPSNKLTGDAFLKQVLGVLGYKADVEGYNVTGWQVSVAIDALNAGLLEGMEENFNSANLITREQAAQIILNALQADMVYYPTQSSIQIGDITINNSSEAKKVENAATADYDKTVISTDGNGDPVYRTNTVQQLCEKAFPTLKKVDNVTDDMARPATQWNYKGQSLVLAVDNAEMTYVASPKYKDVYAVLGLTDKEVPWVAYEDGVVYSNANWNNGYGYNGKLTVDGTSNMVNANRRCAYEIYYDSTKATPVTAIMVNEYVGKVSATSGSGDARKITIVPMDNATESFPDGVSSVEFTTTEYAVDDVVVFTYSYATSKVQTVKIAEYLTGEITRVETLSGRADIFVDDVKVSYAWGTADGNCDLFNKSGLSIGDTVNVYLDSNSYYLYVEEVEAVASDKFAYVLDAADEAAPLFGTAKHFAQLLMTDGTIETVETDELYTAEKYDFVTYSIDEDGLYVLDDADNNNVNDTVSVDINGTIYATIGGSVTLSSSTIFVVKTEVDGKAVYTSYLGHKNVPKMDGTTYADAVKAKSTDTAVAYVFVDATANGFNLSTTADKVDYLYINTTDSGREYADANNTWYQYNAVVNGEVETIMVDASCKAALSARAKLIFSAYKVNDEGFYFVEAGDVVTPTEDYINVANGQGLNYVDGLLLAGINKPETTAAYEMDEDVVIIYNDSNAVYLWTEANLKKDTNDYSWLYDIDGDADIDFVVIQKMA